MKRQLFSLWVLIGVFAFSAVEGRGAVVAPAGYVVEVYATNVASGKDLAFDSRGNLYVAHDSATAPMYKIAPGGANVTPFGPSLEDADALAVDAQDNVYIGSEGHGLYVVAPNGASHLVTANLMGNIFSLCIDRAGLFGSPGDVFVGNARSTYDIVRVNAAGQASSFVSNSVLSTFPSMAFDDVGFLYAAENSGNYIYKVSPAGAVSQWVKLSAPYSLVFDPRARIFYVGDTTDKQIYRLSLEGTISRFAQQVSPYGLTLGPDGCLYVTDRSTTPARVLRFRRTFLLLQITRRGGGDGGGGGPCASCCAIDHRQPILSPDGGWFVFSSTWNADDYAGNLNPERNRELFGYIIAANKFQQWTITTNGMSLPYAFQGNTVGFISCSTDFGGNRATNVQVFGYDLATRTVAPWVNTAGPAPIRLGTNCPYVWFTAADWTKLGNLHADLSANQRTLVWASTRNLPSADYPGGDNWDGNYEIYWHDLGSGQVRQLTRTTGGDNVSSAAGANLWPRASADGSKVVFVSNRAGAGPPISSNRYGLFLASTNGAVQRLTTAELEVAREFPAFGMDSAGTRLVFASEADLVGLNTNHNREIYALDLCTSNLTQITQTGAGVTNSRPILSGDGFKVAFLSNGNLDGSAGANVEQLWVYHFDLDLAYPTPFLQITSLGTNQPATGGRGSWADWYSFDYTGANLVFTSNADLVGSNGGHAYEVFLASFDWQPFRCAITRQGANQYRLNWLAPGTPTYTLESCASLGSSTWAPVSPTNQWPTAATGWTNTLDPGQRARFFRVRAN